jgi:hypothetical protein
MMGVAVGGTDAPRSLWGRIWFAPGPAVNLAAARIIIAFHALWILLSRDFPAISNLPEPFWRLLSPAIQFRFLIFQGNGSLEHVVQWLAMVALAMTVLGLFTRFSAFAAGILLYHIAPLETIIWTPTAGGRGLTVAVLSLLILSFARCDQALTISRLFNKRPAVKDSWEYVWALKLLWLLIAWIYFFAGYSKIFRTGVGWISGENVRRWFLLLNQQDQFGVFNDLGPWLAEQAALCWVIAAATILLELLFPVVLVSLAARRILVPAAVIGHFGIMLAMNIAFLNVPQLLIFVNWNWLRQRLSRSAPS